MKRRDFLFAVAFVVPTSHAIAEQRSTLKRVAMVHPVTKPGDMRIGGDPNYAILFEEMQRLTTLSPDQANALTSGWRWWRSSNRRRSGSLFRAFAAVATRLECVAQCWPPVPPRGHCQRRTEVFVRPRCFSTG
jgi:hypothetical protein